MFQWIEKLVGKVAARSSVIAKAAAKARPVVGTPVIGTVEGLEDRRLLSGSLDHGIDLNTLSSSNYNTTLNMLHDTGTRSVRMWVTVNNFNSRNEDGVFKYIRKIHSAGIDVTLSVVPRNGLRGSDSSVESYFSWIAGRLGGSVDRWEIGNEVDMSWRGQLSNYVNDLLKPAAAGLHSHGEKVMSGSVSWNPADVQTMVNAGMLNYVDYVGYHPYRSTVKDLIDCVSQVKSMVGGKPLFATEWSPRGQSNSASWNSAIQAFWPVIRDNFAGAYYYAAFRSGTMAGAGGIMNNGGSHNGAFYSTFKGLSLSGSGSSTVTTSSKPKPTTPTTVTKPVAVVPAPKPTKTTTTTKNPSTALEKSPTTDAAAKAAAVAKAAKLAKAAKAAAKAVKAAKSAKAAKVAKAAAKAAAAALAATKPVVSAFALVDANTGKVLKGFEHITASETIKLKALPTRYIQVVAITDNVKSVKFTFSGKDSRLENYASFTAFANTNGTATGWQAGVGSYTLTAKAFAGRFGTGDIGNKLGVVLSFR